MRNKKITRIARRLRQNETDLEHKLWLELRDRRALGLKFRRQHPVGPYFADFACVDARLLIEVDGYWHAFRKSKDAERDRLLRVLGFDVVRYDIENELADVNLIAEAIAHEALVRIKALSVRRGTLTPGPSPAPWPNTLSPLDDAPTRPRRRRGE